MTQIIFNSLLVGTSFILLCSLVLVFVRLFTAKTLATRVMVLDLSANCVIALIALFAVKRGLAVYVDVILSLALVIFLATVAYAQYIESRLNFKKDRSC